jgi:hypothetical protein
MKHINTRPEYAAAVAELNALSNALSEATAQHDRLTAALSEPEQQGTALATAKAMLSGKPAHRGDIAGLNRQRNEAADRLAILRPAVEQQREVVATIRDNLSAAACTDAQQAHAQAAQRIVEAIEVLSGALAAEAAQRDAIEAAGYRCTLPAMACPALELADSQSLARQFQGYCEQYAADVTDKASGLLDKPAAIRLLVGNEHGLPGDVVSVPGLVARMLQRMGWGEPSKAKPHRVPRLRSWQTEETILS